MEFSDKDDQDIFDEVAAINKSIEDNYKAIGRAGALLLILKYKDSSCQKYEIMKARQGDYLYNVRKVGFLGSKPVPGFTLGKMVDVENQLRAACERIIGPISDEYIDDMVMDIDLSPVAPEKLVKKLKAL